MKGQSQIISFILLFAIGTGLLASAVLWSNQAFKTNKDYMDIESAENMMSDLESKIESVAEYGGMEKEDITVDGTVELKEKCFKNYTCLEYKTETSVEIPNYWVYLENDTSVIRERRIGTRLQIQLFYPYNETNFGYGIEMLSGENRIGSIGSIIEIQKSGTYYQNNMPIIKIKLTFR